MARECLSYCKAIDPDVTHSPTFKLMAQPLRLGTEMLDLVMKNHVILRLSFVIVVKNCYVPIG